MYSQTDTLLIELDTIQINYIYTEFMFWPFKSQICGTTDKVIYCMHPSTDKISMNALIHFILHSSIFAFTIFPVIAEIDYANHIR